MDEKQKPTDMYAGLCALWITWLKEQKQKSDGLLSQFDVWYQEHIGNGTPSEQLSRIEIAWGQCPDALTVLLASYWQLYTGLAQKTSTTVPCLVSPETRRIELRNI